MSETTDEKAVQTYDAGYVNLVKQVEYLKDVVKFKESQNQTIE